MGGYKMATFGTHAAWGRKKLRPDAEVCKSGRSSVANCGVWGGGGVERYPVNQGFVSNELLVPWFMVS